VNHYVATAEPVGSKTISHNYLKELSPATIRNVMQDLEEMGLVEQPHTSAGRIPTVSGYRLFVDSLLEPEELTPGEQEIIRNRIGLGFAAIEGILGQTSKVLGDISLELGLALAPRFEKGILTRLELIPVADKKILVVLALKSGLVRSLLLEVESNLSDELLEETRQILNEKLQGLTVSQLKETGDARLNQTTGGDARVLKMFLESSDEILNFDETGQIHLGGAQNLLRQPEFQNQNKLQNFMLMLEERKFLIELISSQGTREGITITIGPESENGRLSGLSLVTCSYQAGKVKGTLGVIGPNRMPYSKLISLVDYTAKVLGETLSE
jgi:heat-inducible transcriptional repressor